MSSDSSISSGSASDWVVEDSDSTFESNDRFRFEPNEEIDGVVETILQKQKPKYVASISHIFQNIETIFLPVADTPGILFRQ